MHGLSEAHRQFFEPFIEKIKADLCAVVADASDRFPSGSDLINRFGAAAVQLVRAGLDRLNHFQEVHNELCVAVALVENTDPVCSLIEYEPRFPDCQKRFDFRAEFGSGPARLFEVKTIHPIAQDDWGRYESAVQTARFPDNAQLVLEREWLGGELYHNAYASRAKLLDYTLETESKTQECLGPEPNSITHLMLCTNGFDWHVDMLEDFVYFYRHGRHFNGDHFRLMEEHYIVENNIQLLRNIHYFGYLRRPTTEARPAGGTWSVPPVQWPPPGITQVL